jgi:vacuolar-type H+-ATPase subunit D/Vma8
MKARSVPPTRSGLVRANAQLGRVQKGRELLNRKREALITELFKSARPALNARQGVEERASEAYQSGSSSSTSSSGAFRCRRSFHTAPFGGR